MKFEWITEDTREFLNGGYLLPGTSPEQRLEDIAQRASDILHELYDTQGAGKWTDIPKPDWIHNFKEKFLHGLSRGWYSLSSPIWSNFGLDRGLPISCFGSHVPDSMDGILETAKEIGMMSKYGGGTAAYFGDVRGRGAPITDNGYSEGAVNFMRLFDTLQDVTRQGETRRGSTAVYLPVDHPDIMEFLDIRDDGSDIQLLSFAVTIPEGWMQSMIDGDPEKRKVWARVLERRSEAGMPYVTFMDNVNNETTPYSKRPEDYYINHSQLCVTGDTQILTDKGQIPIGELEGEDVNVWNGQKFSPTTVVKTGVNQKLVRVTTDSGYELDCTPYHKFYVQENSWTVREVPASELKEGDKLIKFDSLPVIEGEKELEFAYDNGFFTGDGCYSGGKQIMYLYNDKQALVPHLPSVNQWSRHESSPTRLTAVMQNVYRDKFFVPGAEYTVQSRLAWLAGYLDADGTVTNNNGSQSIQAASTEVNFLREVQLMLQTLGVDSKVTLAREAGTSMLPKNDGTGDYAEYPTREAHRLLINGNSLYKLDQLGLTCHRLTWETRKPNRECSRFVRVASVEALPDRADTFCFTEPERNMGTFAGLLTGNCNEIFLPTNEKESFVCCLSSMNIAKYDEWVNTDAVDVLTYFLDAVMEEFIQKSDPVYGKFHGLERAHEFAVLHRALGIGALGWHSYLQSKSIPFGSLIANSINSQVFRQIQRDSYRASENMGRAFGTPRAADELRLDRRNTVTTAVAPTTSSAFILGQVSQSIEPLRSNYFIRGLAKTTTVYKNPELEKVLEEKNKNTPEVWADILIHDGSVQHLDFLTDHEKDVFKTFEEISQLDIIIQAGVRQKYIDQGQSLNIAIHPDTPAKDISQLHIEAWERGIKGLYYMHGTNAAQAFNRDLLTCSSCQG